MHDPVDKVPPVWSFEVLVECVPEVEFPLDPFPVMIRSRGVYPRPLPPSYFWSDVRVHPMIHRVDSPTEDVAVPDLEVHRLARQVDLSRI